MFRKVGVVLGVCVAAIASLMVVWPLFAKPVSEQKLTEMGLVGPDSSFVDLNGVKTRFIAKGAGAETIIFIHGFSSSLFTWETCLDTVAQQYRVYALDLPGFGFSGKPDMDYTIDGYVDSIKGFMDKLDARSAILCGNSMGGNIAWRTALKYPDRVEKLILVDASGYPFEHKGIPLFVRMGRIPGVGELFGPLITRGRIRESLESAYFENSKVTEHTVDMYYYPMKTAGAMNAVLACLRSLEDETRQWVAKIPSLTLPTLIVWGEKDTWVPLEDAHKFHKDITGSELVILPGCGHLPQEEFPQEFVAVVLDFLSRQETQAAPEETAEGLEATGYHFPLIDQRQTYHL